MYVGFVVDFGVGVGVVSKDGVGFVVGVECFC